MKLQAKIVLLLAVLIFFFTTVEYGILRLRIAQYHRAVEREYAEANFRRCAALVEQQQAELREVARALAAHGANGVKTLASLSGSTQAATGLLIPPFDIAAIVDRGNLAWWTSVDSVAAGQCGQTAQVALAPFLPLLAADTSGLVNTTCGPLVLASAPCSQEGQRLVVSRFLAEPIARAAMPWELRATFSSAEGAGSPQEVVIDYGRAAQLVARGVLRDITGKPTIGLEVASPKVFLARQEQTLLLALLANTVIGLAVAFIVMALFQKLIIKRINSLVDQVAAIRVTGDFGLRVQVSGTDEVGTLATAFNEALARLHQMAQRIEESEQRYATLVEQSRDGVAILVDGKVRFANRRLMDMAGCKDLEQLAAGGLSFLPEEVRRQVSTSSEPQSSIGAAPIRLLAPGGEEIELEVDLVHGTYDGQPATFLYLRDVSEKKRMERHLQRVDKLTSLGQLSSGIAHEIRTPLGSIQLNLDHLLQCTQLTSEQRHILESSMEAVNRISSIVQRTLDFARPAEPSFEKLQIRRVVDNVLKMMATNLSKAKVSVVQEWADDLPMVQADWQQLNQVFVNIVLNAVQAMPRGGRLRIWGRPRGTQEAPMVEVGFEDTGVGIAPEDLRRVFDPFFTTKHEGVGLGLSVVHRILESHRATIDISSTPGEGTTVCILFPAASEERGEDG
ncbi:MAG: HAMP domain-containing protein [Calditrichaeota bacterium]|nr:HAMP domain-containing protein [Calditrichota bacterium]